jgi:hypothetical protein
MVEGGAAVLSALLDDAAAAAGEESSPPLVSQAIVTVAPVYLRSDVRVPPADAGRAPLPPVRLLEPHAWVLGCDAVVQGRVGRGTGEGSQ